MKRRSVIALLVAVCGWLFLSSPLSAQIVLDTLWSRTTLAPMELCTWNFFCRTLSAIGPNSSLYMLARDDISHSHLLAYDSMGNTLMDQDLSALSMALETMVVDGDGNVYIAGREYASYPYTIKIVKYGPAPREYVYPVPDGAAHFPSSGDYAAINGMVLDNDGNVYIVGYQCTSYDSEQYRHNMDMVVAKFTPDLDLVWCDIYDSGPTSRNLRGDLGLEICRGENNSVFVVGAVLIAEDPVDPNNLWDTDIIVRKYNADGLVWSHTWGKYGQWGEELPTDMSADNQGNLYIGTKSWHIDIYSRCYSYSVLRCAESGVDELLNQVFDYGSGGPWPADPYYRVSLGDDSTVYVIADDSAGAYTSVSSYNSAMTENWSIPLALGEFYVGEDASFYYSSFNPPVLYKNDRNNALLGSIALNPRMFVNLEVDRANQCAYAVGSYYDTGEGQTLYKLFRIGERQYSFRIRDALGDSIPNIEFELIRVMNNPPQFDEDTLGTFTTDDKGRLALMPFAADSFRVDLDLTTDTLVVGDNLKIARHVNSVDAVKHQILLGTMYSVHLDNAQFAEDGHMFFDTVTSGDQDIVLNHTEIRYNLLVSVEWDAERPYLLGLQDNIRAMSNYLYDVSDGQIRLDTVVILDDHQEWDIADIQVQASNIIGSYTWAHAIYLEFIEGTGGLQPASIVIPRRDYGDALNNRDSTYSYHPLEGVVVETYRVLTHELGHYAFGFYDEYLFCCLADGSYDKNRLSLLKCAEVDYYGYMHWLRSEAGERASEMSSAGAYTVPECRNTKQYHELGMSCWDYLEAQIEGTYDLNASPSASIWVPVITPSEPERTLPEGLNYLPGPNNYLGLVPGALDYDVGALIVFPQDVLDPAPQVKSLHVNVFGVPAGGVQVKLNKAFTGGILAIDQGKTTDLGLIWVMGAKEGVDQIDAGVNRFEVTAPPGMVASSTVGNGWLFASAPVTSNDSVNLSLEPIVGDYPVICEPSLGATDLSLRMIFQTPFNEIPTLAFYPYNHNSITPTVTIGTGSYDAVITDSLRSAGELEISAIDASARSFRFWADYTHTGIDSSELRILGPRRLSLVGFDSLNTDIERALLMTSPYPVIRDGLNPDAVQAGETQSLSIYPSSAMTSNGVMTIGYDDATLMLGNGLKADESSLQLYQWDSPLSEWVLIGGYVDTVLNEVWSAIPGTGVYAAFTTQIITDVEDDGRGETLPYRFELSQNYPNPFNPVTTIEYSLPERSHVVVEVYNVLGQKVRTLVDREESAGSYTTTWDGTSSSGQPVSTGVYLYRFQAGDHIETKKMVLLK